MDLFTKGDGIVRWDGWIDLPQKMGRVRLNSEYLAFDPDSIYIEGAHIPNEKEQEENVPMTEQYELSEEESKDDPMSGQLESNISGK